MLRTYKLAAFSLALGAGVLFSSCSKELDVTPESAVSPDQINESNVGFFLNGLYRAATPERDNYLINDIRGGNYTWTPLSGNNSAYGRLITGNGVDDGLSYSSSLWKNTYRTIYSANNVIQACDKLGAQGSVKVVKAEASYLRAYLYYQLVTAFGGVPVIVENTTENLPRNTADQVWEQIIKDLDFAIAESKPLKEATNKRVSKEAATALKARVLLARGNKAEAAQLAQSVIQSSGLGLVADYGSIFRNTASSREVLFAFSNLKTETNLRFSSLFWPYGTAWAGSYFVQPSTEVLESLYTPEDVRGTVNIDTIYNADKTYNVIVSKYWDVQPVIVSRLSEMYLISAEGLPLEQGLVYMNALRKIRGVEEYELADFASPEAYLEAVLEERRRELYSEGFLFFDLVRTGKAIDLPNIQNTNQYVLPLPGDQINLSNGVLTQNQGY